MNIAEAISRMKDNPGLKMCMPNHYHDDEYNYYDSDKDNFFTETGEIWDIGLSIGYNEINGYEDWIESEDLKRRKFMYQFKDLSSEIKHNLLLNFLNINIDSYDNLEEYIKEAKNKNVFDNFLKEIEKIYESKHKNERKEKPMFSEVYVFK